MVPVMASGLCPLPEGRRNGSPWMASMTSSLCGPPTAGTSISPRNAAGPWRCGEYAQREGRRSGSRPVRRWKATRISHGTGGGCAIRRARPVTAHFCWTAGRAGKYKLSALASDTMGALSADNSKIVFTSDRGAFNFNLWIVPLSNGIPSSQPLRLTDPPGIASHPSFSPDGHWIVFYRILKETRTIWVVPVQGGQPIQFTDGPSLDIHPAWSPDGTRIAWTRRRRKGIGQLRIADPWRDGRRTSASQRRLRGIRKFPFPLPSGPRTAGAIAFCGTKRKPAGRCLDRSLRRQLPGTTNHPGGWVSGS